MTEHPRRCKTCNDHTCRYAPVNGDYKTSSKRGAWKCTAEKGCASHSTPTEQRKPDLSHITPERKGCLTCLAPDCPIWQAADQNCWKLQPYTTTERDKVLDILTLIELWISDYQDLNGNGEIDPEQLREMLESFRTHPEAP